MPRIQVDLREAVTFEAATPGTYELVVDEIDGPHKGPKSMYLRAAFKFVRPELAKKHGKVFRNYPINGEGAGFFREFWKKLTGEELHLGEDAVFDVDTDEVLGKEFTGQIGNEPWEGELRNQLEKIL